MSERNIEVIYLGRRYPLALKINEPVEYLRTQLFSVTEVEPEEQMIIGFRCGILNDNADLSKLNVRNGQRIVLIRRAKTSLPSSSSSSSVQSSKAEVQKDTTVSSPLPSPSISTPISEPTPSSTSAVTSEIQNLNLNSMKATEVLWQENCSRIYLKERCVQPSFVHVPSNKTICYGCATTCQSFEGKVKPNSLPAKSFFSCECNQIPNAFCLFDERTNGVDYLQGEEKNKLLDILKAASIQQFQQLNRQQQQKAVASSTGFKVEKKEEGEFIQRFNSTLNQVIHYEDPSLQAKARSIIPISTLESRARNKMEEGGKERGKEDEEKEFRFQLLHQLTFWFKHEFFKWTNEPACQFCGGKTRGIGGGMPTPEESFHQAFNVEIYACNSCQKITRFPRYNDPSKLLDTREGRCGEWANCFTLCCRAMGMEARYVWDATDHVWTEVWSDLKGRWLHVDSCEALVDSPLVYESGWGKKLSYVFSFSHEQMADTIRRYSQKMDEVQTRRTKVSEEWLKKAIDYVNQSRAAAGLSPERIQVLNLRYEKEQQELERGHQALKEDEMQGRISGSKEWRDQRGETGSLPIPSSSQNLECPSIQMTTTLLNLSSQDFEKSGEKFQLVGEANLLKDRIRLTKKENDQTGAFWLRQKINIKNPFDVQFEFEANEGGADGFAFVIQNEKENAMGRGGCDLGYGGISNSVAVEYDTYASVDRANDPNGNHISVHSKKGEENSSHHMFSLGCVSNLSCKLNDGKRHKSRILYFDGNLFVFLDDLEKPILKVKILLEDHLKTEEGNAWIGFTAATGGISQAHDIHSLRVSLT